MDFKNTAENLFIILVVMVSTSYLTYKVTISAALESSVVTAKSFVPAIEKAIDKETIKNEISNDISLEIDKIKKSDSLTILVEQKPTNKQEPDNKLSKEVKLSNCPKGSICIPVENLTRRQKKRLKL